MTHADDRIDRFQALVEEDDANELAQFSLAQALLDAGRSADALAHFQRTYELEPEHMMAYYRAAECLMQLGRLADARPLLETTIRLAVAQNHVGPRADAQDLWEEIEDSLG